MSTVRLWKVSSSITDKKIGKVHARKTQSFLEMMSQGNLRDQSGDSSQADLKLTSRR